MVRSSARTGFIIMPRRKYKTSGTSASPHESHQHCVPYIRIMPEPSPGPDRQREIYLQGFAGIQPKIPMDPARFEQSARAAMSREAFAYIAGGAGLESTITANRAAFEKVKILPRM